MQGYYLLFNLKHMCMNISRASRIAVHGDEALCGPVQLVLCLRSQQDQHAHTRYCYQLRGGVDSASTVQLHAAVCDETRLQYHLYLRSHRLHTHSHHRSAAQQPQVLQRSQPHVPSGMLCSLLYALPKVHICICGP